MKNRHPLPEATECKRRALTRIHNVRIRTDSLHKSLQCPHADVDELLVEATQLLFLWQRWHYEERELVSYLCPEPYKVTEASNNIVGLGIKALDFRA